MRRMTFWAVTVLAGIYVLVAIAETYMYSTLDKTMAEQHELQARLSHVEQINGFAQQLVRRMIVDSANDPALIQILKMNGVNVGYSGTSKPVPTSESPDTPETPVSPIQN